MPLKNTMKLMTTSSGKSVYEHSLEQQIFLIFLRHFGCIFCREALFDLSRKQAEFKQKNVLPIFVHMADQPTASEFFSRFQLVNPVHVSDPSCTFYTSFGLVKGKFNQLFGLKSLVRGIETASKGIFPTVKEIGDGYQMPGIFIVRDGNILESFIHQHASDKPDYQKLITCCGV